jgi:hypothetical protein
MFSVCANPDCQAPFDYRRGRLFRFEKHHPGANSRSLQHFWLCALCSRLYTLEYRGEAGVLIKPWPETSDNADTLRFIAAA